MNTIRHRDDAVPFVTKDTSTIREILHPTNSAIQHQSLAEATLPSGARTQAHFHPHSEEIYYVLRGQGILKIEGEEISLISGHAVAIAPGARHQVENRGTQELVFLCCCAPPYSHGDTILCDSLFED
jgi:mannose-6-phosphate isomerase-like protein (cupin superfamily)